MGVLITPMALAHPLHPIKSRSRNKRRNLWVGWCVSSWRPWFWPVHSIYYIHTTHYSRILTIKYTLSKRHTYQKLERPCWCIGWFVTVWFQEYFQLCVPVFSVSWYGYRYLWHCTLVSSTPLLYSQSDWLLGVHSCSKVMGFFFAVAKYGVYF